MKKTSTHLLMVSPPFENILSRRGISRPCLALLFFLFALQGVCFAQPTVLGTQLVNGGYTTYNLTTVSGFKQVRILALNNGVASSLNWEFLRGSVGAEDYSVNWRPYTAGQTLPGYNTFIDPATATASARYNTGFGGQAGLLPAVTAGSYYTFNITNNGAANNSMSVLETTYNPETITSVTRSPVTVGGAVSPTITITASAAPQANVYVRYSTDNFVTSDIVQASFAGVTGTAVIPAQAAGLTVRYYVYNSPKTSAQITADVSTYGQVAHDMATLNLNNNGGANYSYLVLPVTVTGTNSANDASYSTFALAISAISSGVHTGVVTVLIAGNTAETASASLQASGSGGASYSSVLIRPFGNAARTVSINITGALFNLAGADNVTVDGLNDGSGNTLTFSNSSTNINSSTITFFNDCTNDIIQNCVIEGSCAGTTNGVVVLSGTNSNLSFISNTIKAAGVNLPTMGLYSSGVCTAISVLNNNFQDYNSPVNYSSGVFAHISCDNWTVTGNKFYQTAPRAVTFAGSIRVSAIYLGAGGGHTVNNNIIGYANANGTGVSDYTFNGTGITYIGIYLSLGSTVSSVQGNTVSGLAVNGNTTISSPGLFDGIYVFSGSVDIGTLAGNTIGAGTGTGAISITSSGASSYVAGINVNVTSPNTANIQNNKIGSINMTSATAGVGFQFNGITSSSNNGNCTVGGNLVGSISTANSINVGIGSTSNTTFYGVSCTNSGALAIAGNTIENCTASGTGASGFTGILGYGGTGTLSITANNIIACTNAGTGSMTGISNSGATSAVNISDNTLRSNTVSAASGTFSGILSAGTVPTSVTINDNKLGNASGGLVTFTAANSGTVYGIRNQLTNAGAAVVIQGNDIRGIVNNVQGTGSHIYISNTGSQFSQNISNNTFTNLTSNLAGATSAVTFISNDVSLAAGGSKTINDNRIVTGFTKTGASTAGIYFYYDNGLSVTGTTVVNDNNNFSNITINGATPLLGWFNGDGNGANIPTKTITNNTFNNITANTSAVSPLQIADGTGNINNNSITNCSVPNTITALTVTGGTFSMFSNVINTLSSSGTSSNVTGISVSAGTSHTIRNHVMYNLSSSAATTTVTGIAVASGTTVDVYKNKIYGLSESAALASGGVNGIAVSGGTTVTAYNNFVGGLTANAATFNDAVRGINISGASGTANIYYNTVYLDATTGGTNFGSAALYSNTGPTLNLRNNILVNVSNSFGTGRTVAYRRNGTSLANYAATSNNNLFYAGTPGATRLIYYDGTNSYQTLAAYQAIAGLAPRDAASQSVALTFISTTGSSANYLHLNTTSAAESGAANIAGFTDDYEDDIRQGNPGYTGTGTAPDIGADEFESIICPATPTITGISSPAPYYAGDVITVTGTNLSGIAYATINDINVVIGATTATTANLTIPVTMSDRVGVIQVAYTGSCTYSTAFNFVFAGYITKGAGAGSGNWNLATIWRNNAIPVANSPATINTGDAVVLNVSADPCKLTVNSTASLTQQNNSFILGATYLANTTVNGILTIDNAGTPVLTSADRFLSQNVVVRSGGTFTNNSANAQAVTIANFYVDAGGNYNHNATGSTPAGVSTDFPGSAIRTFGNTSNVVITKWANGNGSMANLPASGSPGWGNLTINVATLAGSWNQQGTLTAVQGNLNIMATGGFEFRLVANTGDLITSIGGNLTVSGGIFKGTSGSSQCTVNVAGNTVVSGGALTPSSNSGSAGIINTTGSFTVNGGTVTSPGSSIPHIFTMGSLVVSSGTFGLSGSNNSSVSITSTGNMDISGTGSMASASTGNITINCGNNFSVSSNSSSALIFQTGSNASAVYRLEIGGNFNMSNGTFVGGNSTSPDSILFKGGAASVTYTQSGGTMAVTSPRNSRHNFAVYPGKTLTLNSSIIPASSSTSNNWSVTVYNGGTLNCGATSQVGNANGYTIFRLNSGATLQTGHTGGVFNTTAGAASITTTAANAILDAGATYVFNGIAPQVSSVFTTTPAATPSNVANMVINNSTGVTLSAGYNVTGTLQMLAGNLTLSTFNLTAAGITGAPYSNTKMVVTNNTGALGLPVPTAGLPAVVLFPVGNGGNYTPANYTFSANSTARYLNVRAVTPRNSNDLSPTNYINNRWWNTDLSVTTGTYTYTSSYTYITGDVAGSAAAIHLNRWTGSTWVDDPASSVNTGMLTLNSGSLTQTTGPLAATAQWVGRAFVAPSVYHWINPAGGSWLVSTNWTPTGVPGSGDGVVFDVAGGATYTTTNMPTSISLTQFTVSTNNMVTYNAGAVGSVNMIFPGTATPQFSVASGSSVNLSGANAVNINLPVSATGSVAGTLRLQQAAHTVTVANAGALVFTTGSYFATGIVPGTGFNGNPFGATGTNGAVIFQNGSVCETFEGSNPFGNAGVNITTFQTNSLFRYSDPGGATLPSISGRTYSNFTYNVNKVSTIAAASSFICDSLTVTMGTFNLNLQGTPTPDHSIKGNINIATGATLSFTPGTGGTVNMNSGAIQLIRGAGTFNVNALSTFDINAGTTVSLEKNMGVNSTGNVIVNGSLFLTGENYINTPITAGGTVTLNNGGTLFIQSVNGISNTGVGNIRSTNFTYNSGGNFTYSGTASQVTGNRLPLTLSGTPLSVLTIANMGTAPNNIVTLTTNNTQTARINLNEGQFNAGTGGTLIIGGGTNIVSGGSGNQYLAGTATDNIIRFAANGAVQGIPELYNVTIGNSVTGVDFTNNARINGIFLINSGGFVNPNAPKYNTGSYLIYNTGGGYNRSIEWGNNSGLGTAGYPHHVTVQNGTTLDLQNPAFDMGCGGDLTLGTATAGTLVLSSYLQPYDLYVKGNINIGGAATGTLTMSNSVGCDLRLNGNWVRNATGVVNFGGGNGRSVYFEGSSDVTITAAGGQYFPYLRMQKTAKANKVTLADHVSIGFEATFTRGTLDLGTNNKFFTILSNANVDGRVDVSDSANTAFVYGVSDNTGQFIVQRYMPARRSWRLVNAPFKAGGGTHSISQAWQERGNGATGLDYTIANWVASVAADTAGANYATQISGGTTANGFDASPNNNASIKYFSGAGVWSTPANTNSTSVNSQEGWMLFVRGDRETYGEITTQYKTPTITTLRPRGQIFIGQKTLTANGMTVVGNPYASAVDFFSMSRTGAGWPAQPTYYVWDPYLGGPQGVGAFVTLTWNGTNFTRSSPYGASGYDNRYIPSGAAIMVDFPAGGGTLSMNEANKNTDSTTTAFRPAIRQLATVLQTKDADNSFYVADGALSLFDNSFNNDADVNDARKLSNINENISLRRNGHNLSIERKKLTGEADTIFYYMTRMQRKNYQLKFIMDKIDVPKSTTAFLEDTFLKKKTPVSLSGTTVADFSITAEAASAANERFRLVFRRSVIYTNIHAAVQNNDVAISWSVSDEFDIDHYEIERSANGVEFAAVATRLSDGESDVPVNYNGIDAVLSPGEYYYRIKSVSKMGAVTYSDAVKVKVVKGSPALYVFPNPVTNGTIQLQLNNAVAGIYSTTLYGNNGQVINNELISHAGGTATKTIQPKQHLTNGAYQLKVTGPDNKVAVIKVMIANE